jgi:CTP synthase
MTRYIFMTGGVVSSLGKGLTSASIAALLEARNLKVTIMKLDPYINIDPGTMSPFQHGEVFVTDDGTETDLDLGHYERFTHANMSKANNFTSGQVYYSVIERERRGEYLGKTVQVIPHITDEIKNRIINNTLNYDIAIIEIGGTVGDIESLPFLEAVRQLKMELGSERAISIHMTLVPYLKAANELKTKPTQNSVRQLMQIGIQADVLVCRAERDIPEDVRKKISLYCNVPFDRVISALDANTIYKLPLILYKQGLDAKILNIFRLDTLPPQLGHWFNIVENIENPKFSKNIAIVGKYVDLTESYKSLNEALTHAGIENSCEVNLKYIDSEDLDKNDDLTPLFKDIDAILVPGGFGNRGIEGKIKAVEYARVNKIPFLGICLGMQIAVIEFARNVLKLEDVNSSEFNEHCKNPVIDLMLEQKKVETMGATMRLGAYDATLLKDSLASSIYGKTTISERHRHRYEFNNKYRELLQENGLVISGTSPSGNLVEIIELKDHPFFIASQFHPEFKSKPFLAHPLFSAFVKSTL